MIIAVAGESGGSIGRFVYYRIEGGRIIERECVNAAPGSPDRFYTQLNSLNVDLLIAGPLDRETELGLFDAGINLISGVTGEADAVLSAYLSGELKF